MEVVDTSKEGREKDSRLSLLLNRRGLLLPINKDPPSNGPRGHEQSLKWTFGGRGRNLGLFGLRRGEGGTRSINQRVDGRCTAKRRRAKEGGGTNKRTATSRDILKEFGGLINALIMLCFR